MERIITIRRDQIATDAWRPQLSEYGQARILQLFQQPKPRYDTVSLVIPAGQASLKKFQYRESEGVYRLDRREIVHDILTDHARMERIRERWTAVDLVYPDPPGESVDTND